MSYDEGSTYISKKKYSHLESIQKDLWSKEGKTKVAFIIFAIATMSLICTLISFIHKKTQEIN